MALAASSVPAAADLYCGPGWYLNVEGYCQPFRSLPYGPLGTGWYGSPGVAWWARPGFGGPGGFRGGPGFSWYQRGDRGWYGWPSDYGYFGLPQRPPRGFDGRQVKRPAAVKRSAKGGKQIKRQRGSKQVKRSATRGKGDRR
jgi:hypothetical protein